MHVYILDHALAHLYRNTIVKVFSCITFYFVLIRKSLIEREGLERRHALFYIKLKRFSVYYIDLKML